MRHKEVRRRGDLGPHPPARTSEGGYTLWEFAKLLQASPLGLTHAMSMDGGREAALCVKAGSFRYASFGRWEDGEPGASGVALPAVVAVVPR